MAVKDFVFETGDNTTWMFEAIYDDNANLTSLWVRCLHWPGCDDEGGHGPVGYGVGKAGQQFRVSPQQFWKETDIDCTLVLDAVARVMATGDLADVAVNAPGDSSEGEVH